MNNMNKYSKLIGKYPNLNGEFLGAHCVETQIESIGRSPLASDHVTLYVKWKC